MDVIPTRTVQSILLEADTKTNPSFEGGVKGDAGDAGTTGITGNGTGYPTATAVDAAFAPYTTRATALDALVTAWQTLTLINSWVAYGSGFQAPRARKVGDLVQLNGLIKHPTTPTNTSFCVLPVGFRPLKNLLFYIHTGEPHVTGFINILPTGSMVWVVGNTGYMSLYGLSFSTI